MTQAGAKGPAVPAKAAAVPAAKATSPAAPAVAPKAPQPAQHPQPTANTAVTPKAAPAAPVAPRKGPPPLPPESGPDLHARPAEPMRPRYETAPGMGHAADTPRAPAAAAISREEIEAMIRKSVSDAIAAVAGELNQATRMVFALERRIADLEQRPVAAVAPPPPVVAQVAYPARPAQAAQPGPRAAPAPLPSAIPVNVSLTPVLDVRAIERDTSIVVDSALDGSRRKRNLVILTVLFIVVVFGGLFALLAESYSPHH